MTEWLRIEPERRITWLFSKTGHDCDQMILKLFGNIKNGEREGGKLKTSALYQHTVLYTAPNIKPLKHCRVTSSALLHIQHEMNTVHIQTLLCAKG